jgi:tRNA (cytidine/uridine-2'-O-)-methyltransferase
MRPADDQLALFTRRGQRPVWDLPLRHRLFLIFGSETGGLPADLLARHRGRTYHIPTTASIRSLNLSTAVGIALYASLRASGYPRHQPADPQAEEISATD